MKMIYTIKSPWEDRFYQTVGLARENVLVVSPFIKHAQASKLIHCFKNAGVLSIIQVDILTDLNPDSILAGTLDIEALLDLANSIPSSTITYLPNLHAKVYIADRRTAIITSANLTDGGLVKNFEFGVIISDPQIVLDVCKDLQDYASLGCIVTRPMLESLVSFSNDLKALHQKAERSIRQTFRKAFKRKLEAARLELLSIRAEGKTTHGIFADTILYLLACGPLRTVEMHPLIQRLHPDLCDDSEDRIIKDVHFGKKWKHYVRTAQQHLRRRGLIDFDGTYWRRTDIDGEDAV